MRTMTFDVDPVTKERTVTLHGRFSAIDITRILVELIDSSAQPRVQLTGATGGDLSGAETPAPATDAWRWAATSGRRKIMASETVDIIITPGGLIEELESAANETGATIYNICHRNAGWAIQWHELSRQGNSDEWKDGLVIYRYYKSLFEAVREEFSRVAGGPTLHAGDWAAHASTSGNSLSDTSHAEPGFNNPPRA